MLKGKTIIITGGSNGMGKYMAKTFVEEGANVVITGRDLERLKTQRMKFQETGTILPSSKWM